MIARIAQRSFSEIENYLENTISKCVQVLQIGQIRAGQRPQNQVLPLRHLSQVKPPLQPCALHTSFHVPPCIPSLTSWCSIPRAPSGGESMSSASTFFFRCKRFTWSGPRRKLWELIWALSFSGTEWELGIRKCTGRGSAPSSFSVASACPAPVGCPAPRCVPDRQSWSLTK